MNVHLPSPFQFNRDAKLLIIGSGIFSASFFGIQKLLEVLYLLRLGHGPEYVGLYSAAGALAYMSMSLPGGALGKRFGTRRTILLGGVITVIGTASLPLTEFVFPWARRLWPIGCRMFINFGRSMLNTNLVPALTTATAERDRDDVYAVNNVLRGLGTFLGTMSGGILPGLFAHILRESLDVPRPYRCALWVGAGLTVLGLLPLSVVEPTEQGASGEGSRGRGAFPLLPVALMIAYACVRHSGWATWQAFCNAYMDSDLGLPTSTIGLITGVGQFLAILAPLLAPHLASRYGNGWILMVTPLGTAISLMPLGLISHWAAAGLARVFILVLSAIWMPAVQVFQMELVDPEWRSLAYGAISTAMALGFGLASILGGRVVAASGYGTLFLIGAALSVLSTGLMWGILERPGIRETGA